MRTALFIFTCFALVPLASAQGPMGGMGAMGPPGVGGKGSRDPFSVEFRFMPSQGVRGQNASLSLNQQQITGAVPLGKWGDTLFLGRASILHMGLDTEAVLPRGAAFPNDLWNVNLGVSTIHKFEGGSTFIGSLNFGSASDKPFDGVDELNVNVMALLNVPWGDRDSWMLGVIYSPLGQVPFPIPIVSYRWVPNDEWSVNLGLPLAVSYRPCEEWSFDASYMILTQIRTRATWCFTPSMQLYGGFEWTNQGFHLAGQPIDDRFFYDEKRLLVGSKLVTGLGLNLDVSAGYAWDRTFREGEGIGAIRGDRVDIRPGPFVAARLAVSW